MGMSDLVLSSDTVPQARIDGVWERVSARTLSTEDIAWAIGHSSGNKAAASLILSGLDQDYGFEVGERRSSRVRLRANAVAISKGWGTGISLTLRLLPGEAPRLASLGVEEGLIGQLFPENGLVLVTGVMGSGKSTLLASVLREIREKGGRHICTYEAPLEFDLGGSHGLSQEADPSDPPSQRPPGGINPPGRPLGPVGQSEIPRHVASFAQAVRNLTRRAADVVLVGEARDQETLKGVLEAAELGLTVYTTAHTRAVSDAPTRILNSFPLGDRKGMAAALFSTLRVIVQQRLFPGTKGGRVAVREWLALDGPMRTELLRADERDLPLLVESMVNECGMPLLRSLQREVDNGRISKDALLRVLVEKGKANASSTGRPVWNLSGGNRARARNGARAGAEGAAAKPKPKQTTRT
jgi:defect-in-organelle-trafficking protein DotB